MLNPQPSGESGILWQIIRIGLLRAGISQSSIARNLNLPRQRVCDVVHGRRRHARIQRAIADALATKPEVLFGELTCKSLRAAA